MAKVIVKIAKDGTMTIEGKNFSGPGCTVLIEKLASRLGVVTDEGLLNEYYDTEEHQHIGTDSCKD